MKKLIAISVVFALVAGAVFAADISVDLFTNARLIKGSTAKNAAGDSAEVQAGPTAWGRGRISAAAEDDNGIFGGDIRYDTGISGGNPETSGVVWWKPIEQVKVQLGQHPDGDFAADGVTGWGFYQVAGDVIDGMEKWKRGSAFYTGFGTRGAVVYITPTEALEINIGIPYAWGDEAKNVYLQSNVQVAYTIDGIGKLAVTYDGGLGHQDRTGGTVYWDPGKPEGKPTGSGKWVMWNPATDAAATPAEIANKDTAGLYQKWVADDGAAAVAGAWKAVGGKAEVNDPSKFFLYFGLTAIDNLGIDIGLGYGLSYTTSDNVKYTPPIGAGLGVTFNAGDFGVKARVIATLAGQVSGGGVTHKDPLSVVFDVLPSYAVSETLAVLFDAGVEYAAADADIKDDYTRIGWHIHPYVTIKSSWWAPNFYAGIRIESDGVNYKNGSEVIKDGSKVINWSVPVGIAFSF